MMSSKKRRKAFIPVCGAIISLALQAGVPVGAQTKVDWPSYNGSLTSERFSPLASINAGNAGKLVVACTFDTGETTAFESGLVQVNGAILATTEHDTISIDANSCAQKW